MNFFKSFTILNRYLILLSTFFILVTALMAFIYASVKTTNLWWDLISHYWSSEHVEFRFIEVIEQFLTAIVLLILGVGLYELFIHPLDVPAALKVKSFHELKSSLGNVILLNMVVIFFGNLTEGEEPKRLVMESLAIGVVSTVLILFAQRHDSSQNHNSKSSPNE